MELDEQGQWLLLTALFDVVRRCLTYVKSASLQSGDAAFQSNASELDLWLTEANMIDTTVETVVTLAEAARLLPRRRAGRKCSKSTLYRWTTRGCRGIVLESIQIGATKCTSTQALNRFFHRLTKRSADLRQTIYPTELEAADPGGVDAELDRLGVGSNESYQRSPTVK